MRAIFRSIAVALSIGLAFPAAAQEPPLSAEQAPEAVEGDIIIVQGYRRSEVRNHVWRVLEEDRDAIPRRLFAFCPGIRNFPEEYTSVILRRIRDNAEKAGVELAPERCLPNAMAIFVREPAQFVRSVREEQPQVFETMFRPEIARLIEEDRPVYSWTQTVAATEYGEVVRQGETVQIYDASRLFNATGMALATSFTVIDIDLTENMSLTQIADYLTLQMLLDLRPTSIENSYEDSLIRLFTYDDPRDAPPEMSPMDRTLLEAVYDDPRGNRGYALQRARIVSYMMDKLDEQGLAQ